MTQGPVTVFTNAEPENIRMNGQLSIQLRMGDLEISMT